MLLKTLLFDLGALSCGEHRRTPQQSAKKIGLQKGAGHKAGIPGNLGDCAHPSVGPKLRPFAAARQHGIARQVGAVCDQTHLQGLRGILKLLSSGCFNAGQAVMRHEVFLFRSDKCFFHGSGFKMFKAKKFLACRADSLLEYMEFLIPGPVHQLDGPDLFSAQPVAWHAVSSPRHRTSGRTRNPYLGSKRSHVFFWHTRVSTWRWLL